MVKKMICPICDRGYATKFSLKRHIDTQHNGVPGSSSALSVTRNNHDIMQYGEGTEDDEAQSTDSVENDEVLDDEVDDRMPEGDEESVNESDEDNQASESGEEHHVESSIWSSYGDTAWNDALNDIEDMCSDPNEKGQSLLETIKATLNKRFVNAYKNDLLHYQDLMYDPTHQSVMRTIRHNEKIFGMDEEEAINVAVKQRKYLIMGEAPHWESKISSHCNKNTIQQ